MFVEWQNSFMVLVKSAVMLESFGPTHGESSSALKTAPWSSTLQAYHRVFGFIQSVKIAWRRDSTKGLPCFNEVLSQPGKALQSEVLWLCWHELVCILDIKFGENRVFPACLSAVPKFLAVPMCSLSSFGLSTLSLKLAPFGPDMFSIGLILPFLVTTPNGLARKPGIGGLSKGPATNPFFIHVAIVSVKSSPFLYGRSIDF